MPRSSGRDTGHIRNVEGGTAIPSSGTGYIVALLVSSLHLLVPEQDHRNTVHGAPVTLTNVTRGAANGFGSLRALLGTLYACSEVSSRLPT